MSLADLLSACIGLLVPTSLAFISFHVRGRYGERLSVSLSNLQALQELSHDKPLVASADDIAWAEQEVRAELTRLQAPRFRRVDWLLFVAIFALFGAFGWSMFFALNVVFALTGWEEGVFWPLNIGLCVVSVASFGLWLLLTLLNGQGKVSQKDAAATTHSDVAGGGAPDDEAHEDAAV